MWLWLSYQCGLVSKVYILWLTTYRISSNKRPGAYFLQGLQDPAFKGDRAFIWGPALIPIAYFEGTVDLWRALTAAHLRGLWVLPTGDLHPRQQWPSFVLRENFRRSSRVVFSIWRSKRQSLDERQQEFACQIDRSTNDRLLDAKFAVKLRVCAVCEARPL